MSTHAKTSETDQEECGICNNVPIEQGFSHIEEAKVEG